MSSTQQPPADNSRPSETRTRQRVSVACLPCRKKRIRCDGAVPVCDSCAAKGVACEYNFTESKRKPPNKRYVQALEARIRHLEERLDAQNEAQLTQDTLGGGDAVAVMHFGDANESDDRDLVSAVTGLLGRLNIGDDGQLHYFGSQSNYHLLNGSLSYATMDSTVSMQRQGLAAVECLRKNMPLSTDLQEHLLELYWTWQNPWNYIVHKGAFSSAFQTRTYGKYCTPLLLSAIFALASRYSDHCELRTIPDDPSTAGYAFFEQAKILLLYESQAPTVATVQAAALMSIRALSDNQEALGWLYCGNAARMALNLGLNIDCSPWVTSGLISEDEAEVRKVTWWGCYTLDNYAPNSGLSKKDIENIVARTDLELRAYYINLPSHLRLPSTLRRSVPAHIYQLQQHAIPCYWESPHMKTCRDSASETAKLLRAFKENYTFRFTAMGTVHIAFTAAIIHLIDMKPESNPYRQQAIRDLTMCVDALVDMKTTWCAWSSKALQAIQTLAEEWQCKQDSAAPGPMLPIRDDADSISHSVATPLSVQGEG
ncbi:nitrogen assimilation transcription factor nit-4 [Thelonectria olida]|uniref:Nitrogen assimilation transcription factor nit-4 n=1 Tax=Thelonectria olida TaxID=1576542 RepID=A0A9P9AHT0_9HYPO|nr:nitrogen assimilation transcription factor nit-4 [Thelonectria olida]